MHLYTITIYMCIQSILSVYYSSVFQITFKFSLNFIFSNISLPEKAALPRSQKQSRHLKKSSYY